MSLVCIDTTVHQGVRATPTILLRAQALSCIRTCEPLHKKYIPSCASGLSSSIAGLFDYFVRFPLSPAAKHGTLRHEGSKAQSADSMPRVSKTEPVSGLTTPPSVEDELCVGVHDAQGGSAVNEPLDGRVARARRLRQERSSQLLLVARRLFAEHGYHKTAVQDILDAASVARGTLYLHFDGKRALFDALVDRFLANIQEVVTLVDLGPTAPPPMQQIEDNLHRVMTVLAENRDMTRIVLLMAEGIDSDADEKMADFYEKLRALLQGALVKGQTMGLFGPIDPEVVSQAALGGLKEVALQWIVRRQSDPKTLRRVCKEILSYSLNGMLLRL